MYDEKRIFFSLERSIIMNYYRTCAVAAVLIGAGFMSVGYADEGNARYHRPPSIQVSGLGRVLARPDKADITLAVDAQAKTAKAAREQAAVAMKSLIKAVEEIGIEDKDIQTSYVSLQPDYDATGNKIVRYHLNNQVVVCVRDIDKAGAVVDAAVQAGGDATRVQGLSFAVDNSTEALAQARTKAYDDARKKAEQYAKLAGVSLGKVLHITEGEGRGIAPVPYAGEFAMLKRSADTPVQVGEQEIAVNVEIVFAID